MIEAPITELFYDTKTEAMAKHSATAFHHAVSLMPGAQPIRDGKRYTRRCTYDRTNIFFDAVKTQQPATPTS